MNTFNFNKKIKKTHRYLNGTVMQLNFKAASLEIPL